MQDECKLGLVYRWRAPPAHRTCKEKCGSPFPSGKAVCACNSLAVRCPEAANLWEFKANGRLTPDKSLWDLNKLCVGERQRAGRGSNLCMKVSSLLEDMKQNQAHSFIRTLPCSLLRRASCALSRVRLVPILCAHCVCLAHCQCTSATCSCVLSRSSQQPVTLPLQLQERYFALLGPQGQLRLDLW